MTLQKMLDYVTNLQEQSMRFDLVKGEQLLKDHDRGFTTSRDVNVESFFIENFHRIYPNIPIFGEETGQHGSDSVYQAYLDPRDGTSVQENGGEKYSTVFALGNKIQKRIVLASIYHLRRRKQYYIDADNRPVVCERYGVSGDKEMIHRRPKPSGSHFFGEWHACWVYPSKYGKPKNKDHPDEEDQHNMKIFQRTTAKLKGLFDEVEVSFPPGRKYKIADTKPGSGSSSLYVCEIADGINHAAILMKQEVQDVAAAVPFAKRAGCPVIVLDDEARPTNKDIELLILESTPQTRINVAVYGNYIIREYIQQRLCR